MPLTRTSLGAARRHLVRGCTVRVRYLILSLLCLSLSPLCVHHLYGWSRVESPALSILLNTWHFSSFFSGLSVITSSTELKVF